MLSLVEIPRETVQITNINRLKGPFIFCLYEYEISGVLTLTAGRGRPRTKFPSQPTQPGVFGEKIRFRPQPERFTTGGENISIISVEIF